jgi:hypothetical protein
MHLIDELRENALADIDLLRKNDARGDVFTKSRDVDFAFKTNDRKRAETLCGFIKEMNFGNPSIRMNDNGQCWIVNIVHMPITQSVLSSVSGFMVCLGKLFQVEFDGWGSVIQTERLCTVDERQSPTSNTPEEV